MKNKKVRVQVVVAAAQLKRIRAYARRQGVTISQLFERAARRHLGGAGLAT